MRAHMKNVYDIAEGIVGKDLLNLVTEAVEKETK